MSDEVRALGRRDRLTGIQLELSEVITGILPYGIKGGGSGTLVWET